MSEPLNHKNLTSEDWSELDQSGAEILAQVENFLRRFVAYPSEHAHVAHVLWIAHAHLMDSWESTPRISFQSAERGSGKTRALEVTECLAPNPVLAVNVSPAYLFRKVGDDEEGRPTILYDEVDTLFGSKQQDNGDVLALLNAGHRRGAVSGRCVCVGNKVKTEEIPAYCAVALAGIGNLPDTIGSRSIIIGMRRRAPEERIEPFRRRLHAAQGVAIRDALAQWCASVGETMEDARPELPHGVDDRDADCWEPLLAIADAAGADWPERARNAATALVVEAASRNRTSGVQLLADLFKVFDGAEKLATETILEKLHSLPESAWADIRGKPLNDRGLATRLKKYGVAPTVVRIGSGTQRGYRATDLHDPWKRYYLPHPSTPEICVTSVTSTKTAVEPPENQGKNVTDEVQQMGNTSATGVTQSVTFETAEHREKLADVTHVTHVALFPGMGEAAVDMPDFLRRCTHCGGAPGADNPVQEVYEGNHTGFVHRECQAAWLGASEDNRNRPVFIAGKLQ